MKPMLTFLLGLLFGCGLLLSGMADPAKVLGFLDVAGDWDPSLALVMLGAIGSAIVPVQWSQRRGRSLYGGALATPARTEIDARLLYGSTLFGIGWGLVGYCPGPAVLGLGSGTGGAIIFLLAMFLGIALYRLSFSAQRGR